MDLIDLQRIEIHEWTFFLTGNMADDKYMIYFEKNEFEEIRGHKILNFMYLYFP